MIIRIIFFVFYSFHDVETLQLSIRFIFLYTSLYIHLFDWFFISSLFCLLTYVHLIWSSFISNFQLIKSFDFEFGFCIPGSVNTWDAVYSLPAMSEKLSTNFLKIWIMIVNSIFYYVSMSFAFVTFFLRIFPHVMYIVIPTENFNFKSWKIDCFK